jgi:adenosylcobyric acid synthase
VIDHLLGQKGETRPSLDLAAFKEEQYDKLAQHVRQHVDMDKIYEILTNDD